MSVVFGPYLLKEKIADGGMAELFLATKVGHDGWRRQLAIKRILPQFSDSPLIRELFFQEAVIATRLNHANLVHVDDYQEINGFLCIVQEYVCGKDLRALIARSQGGLAWPLVAYLADEILKALDYLHHEGGGILHRDLTPHNIMVSYEGQIKLIDFGIATSSENGEVAKQFRGKRAYLAPEYLQSRRYDERSEIFSLGVVLLEALLGRSGSLALVQDTSQLRKLLLDKQVGEEIQKFLFKALAIDPEQRYSSAAQMREQLIVLYQVSGMSLAQGCLTAAQTMQRLYPTPQDRSHQPIHQTEVMPVAVAPRRWQRLGEMGLGVLLSGAVILWPHDVEERRLSAPRVAALQYGNGQALGVLPQGGAMARSHGSLEVDSFPWSSVYLNGRFLGVTPLKPVEVPGGDYQLYLVTRDGRSVEIPVNIAGGGHKKLFQKIP